MKSLIAALTIVLSATASAYTYNSSEFRDVEESMCPGLKEVANLTAVCTKVSGSKEVFAASLKNKVELEKLPAVVEFYNVVELNIWPDDSTSMMYWYPSELYNDHGEKVGYRVFHGYHNSEMESFLKVETRYNLRGKLVSIDLIY